MTGRPEEADSRGAWEELHTRPRFLPRFPSEEVVRFVFGQLAHESEKRATLSVLDLGCGGGRHSVFLAREGFKVTAVDFSLTGLASLEQWLANEGLAARVVHADVRKLPFEDASFDAAIAYASLYYLDFSGMTCAASELRRVLKPGAHALVVTRTTDDTRSTLGTRIDAHSVLIESDKTNERGMKMCFLARSEVPAVFAGFSALTLDSSRVHLSGPGIVNSDWIITLRR